LPLPIILDPAFERDALDLIIAVLLGGVIGFEREWRQRLAGGPTRWFRSVPQFSSSLKVNSQIPVRRGLPRRW
jgi:hypothetical protein